MNSNQTNVYILQCPLCMEPLEIDDVNFFPCTCGYQVNIIWLLKINAKLYSLIKCDCNFDAPCL
jgi:hypothetical protein